MQRSDTRWRHSESCTVFVDKALRAILRPDELERTAGRHQQAVLHCRVALGDEPAGQGLGADVGGAAAGSGGELSRTRS